MSVQNYPDNKKYYQFRIVWRKVKRQGVVISPMCSICKRPIDDKYKIIEAGNYTHLTCYYGFITRMIGTYKAKLKKFKNYRKYMAMEKL